MNKFKNAIGIIKACGLNIKGDQKLMEEVKQVESTIIEALEKQLVHKPKTNYDRIRNMSVEELAEFLYSALDKVCFENCAKDTGNKIFCKFGENVEASNCIACMKQYLESECDTE